MHKSYLNETELQLIKGADIIVEKIGGFPSMESAQLIGFSAKQTRKTKNVYDLFDVELEFDISIWLKAMKRYYSAFISNPDREPELEKLVFTKDFEERKIRMLFHNCQRFRIDYPNSFRGEIKFGGEAQEKHVNRHQDPLPGKGEIYKRPYTCFYTGSGSDLIIFFDESECEISAELFD